jgi:hypothetical protein
MVKQRRKQSFHNQAIKNSTCSWLEASLALNRSLSEFNFSMASFRRLIYVGKEDHKQGDQTARILAYWAIVYYGQFLN